MAEGFSVPCILPWRLIRGEPEHIPMYNRRPLEPREIGAISSEDRDARAVNIAACDAHLRDLHRFHNPLFSEAPPQRRGRGRPRKSA